MRKKLILFLAILAIFISAAAGYFIYQGHQTKTEAAANFLTIEVTKGDVEALVTAQGTLEPKDYVDVGAQVSGLIKTLHVDIGDTVKQGDLIAEIDPEVYESQVRGDEARLKTLQAQKAQQKALVKQAQLKNERNQNLVKNKAISREAADDSQTALDVALANQQSIEAQIEEAQSTLEGDRANLGYTKIYAPMDGVVVSQSVKEGQTINANQTATVIVQVADLDRMTVRAQVAEADIMKIRTDMAVYFTTLGSGKRRWNATVRQIEPSPEIVNDVVLYNVLADVDNKDRSLMSGMTTQMFFVVASAKDVAVIPASALTKRLPASDTDNGQAWQVTRQAGRNKTEQVTVIVSVSDRTQAAVTSGLSVGDKIVIPANAGSTGNNSRNMPRRPMMGRL